MPTEEEKKKLAKEKAEALQLEEEKARASAILAAKEENKPVAKEEELESTFKPAQTDENWKKIVKAYKEEFKQEPREEDGVLVFPSKEAAINFFEKQAAQNLEFFVTEVTPEGQPTGFHMYSCGNGQLYKGSLQEIQKQLQDALKQDPQNDKLNNGLKMIQNRMGIEQNPASKMRGALESLKNQDTPTPEAKEEESKTPSPFSTKPKPKNLL